MIPGVAWLALASGAVRAASFPLPGEWPCERGNGRLDGRAEVRGEIREPRVRWRQFAGSTDVYVAWEPGREGGALSVDPGTVEGEGPAAEPRWRLPEPMGEVGGQRQALPTSGDTLYVDALPERPGLERVVFESGFNVPTVNGQWQPVRARCFAWEGGEWRQAWETPPIDMLFISQAVAGDFDSDGNLEIAFLPWYELVILDARTGAIEDRCRFTAGRSYGFLGAYDLEGDGRGEFVVMADFCRHVDVLGYRDGKLALLWQREIEPDISDPQKILRVNPTAAADVDGDGRLEVVVCTYNDGGDGRWHITVHEGLTGEVKADLPDECLQGVRDVNADGAAELLTVAATGAEAPEIGTIRVRALQGGETTTLWERVGTGWALWEPPGPGNTNNCATLGKREVMMRGGHVALRERDGDGDRLTVARWTDSGFEVMGGPAGERLEAVGLAEDGGLLACSAGSAEVRREFAASGGTARPVAAVTRGGAAGTVVVARDPSTSRPVVVAQGAGEELVALEEHEGQPRELWRIAGRGQSTNWPWEARGAVIADLRGDGGRQVLHATASPEGCARLVARELGGQSPEVWHHDFPGIAGHAPVWNMGGLILWQVGHFTDSARMDVLFTVRRSMMHSEESGVLLGLDGRELWRRARQIENRGVGGTPFAIADFDGDGLEDAASLHPSLFYILRGATGEDLIAQPALWPEVRGSHIYWGLPIAGEFEAAGGMDVFFATTRASLTGLVRADGSLAWWDAPDVSPNALPAIGDVDGDGRLEALGIGYPDGARCYDAATGEVKWALGGFAPGTSAGTASADIDSDGRDEALVTIGTTLYCLGADETGTAGRMEWKLDLPATIGPPTVADLTGNGQASVLLQGADGYVYCIGG
ncbi:MAG: hypothetical protein FJX74_04475 [Armatimonadetes bacterium]|nr:hypothetical protein [Armatimonadota bacterium]